MESFISDIFVAFVIGGIIGGIIIAVVLYNAYRETCSSNNKSGFDYKMTNNYSASTYSTKPKQTSQKKSVKWHALHRQPSIKEYELTNGLVYIGNSLSDSDGYNNDACLINPDLKITPADPWEGADEMGYWSNYEDISPKCRGAYLKWLSTGRKEPEAYIGYVFLFFYGLERRLFVDAAKGEASSSERLDIVNEVKRLLTIYGDNRSFSGYANNLLAMELVAYQNDQPIPDYIEFNNRSCTEAFQFILAKYVNEGKAIPANIALIWAGLRMESGLRTPARRCPQEFTTLFAKLYADKFGDGMIVKPNKTRLHISYNAASPSLGHNLKINIPDLPNPFYLTSPLKKLTAIAEEATKKLEEYSRYLGRKGLDTQSLAAISLLPKELLTTNKNIKTIKGLLDQACKENTGWISIVDIYQAWDEKIPTQLNKKELENIANLVENIGYGVAPDIRFHNIKPDINSKIVIFSRGHGLDFQPSKEFINLIAILRLGSIVSQIDGDIDQAELALLQNLIKDNRKLNNIEKDSLLALLEWCLHTPQKTTGIKQKLEQTTKQQQQAIGHILIAVAQADGRLEASEIKKLENLYTVLGLNKKQVISDIHDLSGASKPVTVSLQDKADHFAIPQPAITDKADTGVSLNAELIKLRETETDQAKVMLGDIFAEDTADDTEISNAPLDNKDRVISLDKQHQPLFKQLITKDTWERDEVNDICKKLGLMTDGAMEIINEWAFDTANAPLIDEGNPIHVDIELAQEITNGQQ